MKGYLEEVIAQKQEEFGVSNKIKHQFIWKPKQLRCF
jgi:hypothetical protein